MSTMILMATFHEFDSFFLSRRWHEFGTEVERLPGELENWTNFIRLFIWFGHAAMLVWPRSVFCLAAANKLPKLTEKGTKFARRSKMDTHA